MKKKLMTIGAVVLALALLLTLAPACGKGEKEVKTLKVGLAVAFTGPAAPWGVALYKGVQMLADEINGAGGLRVGGDTYLISLIKADTAAGLTAERLIEQGVKFSIGWYDPLAMQRGFPITEEHHVIAFSSAWDDWIVSPERPYTWQIQSSVTGWTGSYWEMVAKRYPEIKTVASLSGGVGFKEQETDADRRAMEAQGIEQVSLDYFAPGTTDFYPLLTQIVAKNPDAIAVVNPIGTHGALIAKQARELGFEGRMVGAGQNPYAAMLELVGPEAIEGFLTVDAEYSSPVFPAKSRELYAKFVALFGREAFNYTSVCGHGSMEVLVDAIKAADSVDVDAVKAALEDPDFRSTFWGMEVRSGGQETYGINHNFCTWTPLSEIKNGELITLDRGQMCLP